MIVRRSSRKAERYCRFASLSRSGSWSDFFLDASRFSRSTVYNSDGKLTCSRAWRRSRSCSFRRGQVRYCSSRLAQFFVNRLGELKPASGMMRNPIPVSCCRSSSPNSKSLGTAALRLSRPGTLRPLRRPARSCAASRRNRFLPCCLYPSNRCSHSASSEQISLLNKTVWRRFPASSRAAAAPSSTTVRSRHSRLTCSTEPSAARRPICST